MRYTIAWANVLSQNITLRFVVVALTLCSLIFGISAARLALRDPLIIERGCFSSAVTTEAAKHSDQEIKAFLEVALAARFDSHSQMSKVFLSDRELTNRLNEQLDFQKKGISHRVLMNSARSEKDHFVVDGDRLIAIGKVRSLLPLAVAMELRTVPRTEINPYGLVLHRILSIENGGRK